MRLRDVGEWGFIESLRRFAGPDGQGLLDDCAVLPPMAPHMLVSTDASVEGVHFDPQIMSWRDIGFRSLAGALSDLAASGAEGPARYFVAVGAPGELPLAAAEAIYEGMAACGRECRAELAGGDSVSASSVFLAVTVLAASLRPLLRSGALAGDLVYCSGTLGAAARGLDLLREGGSGPEVERFLRPLPRLRLGQVLAEAGASACVDVSDGLYPELKSIADASGVGIEVDEEALPVVRDVPRSAALRYAYDGGEDYELVFTGPPGLLEEIARRDSSLPHCTQIGRVQARSAGLTVRRGHDVEPLVARGYSHFGGGDR